MLSIVVPVYDEILTLGRVLATLSSVLTHVTKQIIVVDDGSTDGTGDWLRTNFPNGSQKSTEIVLRTDGNLDFTSSNDAAVTDIQVIFHAKNKGKGASLRTAFSVVKGDIVVIQDADLEYDPHDWDEMYDLIAVRQVADVVYGSRFFGRPHRSLYYHHYIANRLISVLFNILFNQTLSDIEACYKMMTRSVLQSLILTADDFGIEIEMSAQIARQRTLRIYEIGISYYGRTYDEGKKIDWKDGVKALWLVFKFRFIG